MTKNVCLVYLESNVYLDERHGYSNMNWLNKLERKFGKYSISNLMMWMIGAYMIGFLMYKMNPNIIALLTLSPYHILHGQIWRLVTWIFMPTTTSIFSLLIMSLLYYQLGTALERTWGTFRFNVYIFSGMLFTVLGAFILYAIMYVLYGGDAAILQYLGYGFSTDYINLSIFLAFAMTYPDMQILLMWIIPVKMKWMGIIYGIMVVAEFFEGGWADKIAIVMSLLNFIIFFFSSRDVKRYAPHEVKRRQNFKKQMREPVGYENGARHKCAVCGRTEMSNPELEFRFCSKCEGNYEYCQEHLFTHQHIRRS